MKKVLSPGTVKIFSAKEYIQAVQENSRNIEKVEFILPTIGKKGYGKFRVKYRIPVLTENNK